MRQSLRVGEAETYYYFYGCLRKKVAAAKFEQHDQTSQVQGSILQTRERIRSKACPKYIKRYLIAMRSTKVEWRHIWIQGLNQGPSISVVIQHRIISNHIPTHQNSALNNRWTQELQLSVFWPRNRGINRLNVCEREGTMSLPDWALAHPASVRSTKCRSAGRGLNQCDWGKLNFFSSFFHFLFFSPFSVCVRVCGARLSGLRITVLIGCSRTSGVSLLSLYACRVHWFVSQWSNWCPPQDHTHNLDSLMD